MLNLPVKRRERDTGDERLLTKDYLLLMFSSFTVSLINYFFLAVTPLHVDLIGGSSLIAGVFISVYAFSALLMRPFAGLLSDKYGRVKLLIIGATVLAVFSVAYGLTAVILILLGIRIIMGFGFGMQSTCGNAAAADVVPKSRLAEGLGYFALHSSVAQAIGPGIALAIVAGGALKDFQTLFFVSAFMSAASVVTNCLITYERKRKLLEKTAAECPEENREIIPEQHPEISEKPLPKTFLSFEYAVFVPMVVLILINIGIVGVFGFMAPFAKWKELGNPGLFYTITAIGVIISRLTLGKIVDKLGADVVVIPGIVVIVTCLTLFPFIESRTALFILALPFGLSQGALFPTINAMLFKRCSPARRGTTAGAYYTALDIGYSAGAPLLGALADALDYRFIFWVAAVFAVIGLFVYLMACSDRLYNAKQLKNSQ